MREGVNKGSKDTRKMWTVLGNNYSEIIENCRIKGRINSLLSIAFRVQRESNTFKTSE